MLQQVAKFKDPDLREQIKYGILRRLDHFHAKLDYAINRKPTDGVVTVKFRRFKGLQDGKPIYGPWIYSTKNKPNLLTNGGRDFVHAQVYTNSAAGTRGANYLAVTNDSAAAAAGDTTLASEITTNGLGRADASSGTTHTAGTNTSVLIWTFTCATASQASQKAGNFNASSSGTLMHETVYTAVTLQIADQLQITWTFTAG